jgi:hypothetical protein
MRSQDSVGVDPIADEVRPPRHSVGLTSLIQDEPPFLLMGHKLLQDDSKAAAAFRRTLHIGHFMYRGPKLNVRRRSQ